VIPCVACDDGVGPELKQVFPDTDPTSTDSMAQDGSLPDGQSPPGDAVHADLLDLADRAAPPDSALPDDGLQPGDAAGEDAAGEDAAGEDAAGEDAAGDAALPGDGTLPTDGVGPDDIPDAAVDGAQDAAVDDIGPEPDPVCLLQSPEPWSRSIQSVGGTAVFTEVMYSPAGASPASWVEVHNPLSIDMDLSGWSLAGSVAFVFPEGSFAPPGAYVVVASDPAAMAAAGVAGAYGPWTGALPASAGTLELRSNNGRLMDRLSYSGNEPWPVTAAGSGASLAKRVPTAPSELGESWRASAAPGGTPGQFNFADPLEPPEWITVVDEHADWTVDDSGLAPAAGWALPGFDDSAWALGAAVLFAGIQPVTFQSVLARLTADNFMALYKGKADATGLTYIGRDAVSDWMSVEEFPFKADSGDHLYVAVWEAPSGDQGPQMVIGEVETPAGLFLTSAASLEWILGPPQGAPGGALTDPAPAVAVIGSLVQAANNAGTWAAPAVEADKSSSPWGWAVSAAFAGDPKYVWSDTFGSQSAINTHQTYALFRSVSPILPSPGQTEVAPDAPAYYFRHEFTLPADPGELSLWLSVLAADGVVLYLNGAEVLRDNMPDGPVGPSTPALAAVEKPKMSPAIQIPSALLLPGVNVLAAEVHMALDGSGAMQFAAQMMAQLWPPDDGAGDSMIRLSEIPGAGPGFWVELVNTGTVPEDLAGMVLATSAGPQATCPAKALAPGATAVVKAADLGLNVEEGQALFLFAPGKASVLDGVRVTADTRARPGGTDAWAFPGKPTPGAPNPALPSAGIVINEIMYHHAPLYADGLPPEDSAEEWFELLNVTAEPVDLSGWSIVDAVEFTFPPGTTIPAGSFLVVAKDAAAMAAAHPDILVVGDYKGKLSNSGERLALLDLCGNLADEVRYADGGRWPDWADGGGCSLELASPLADNSVAESWRDSVEPGPDGWTDVVLEGAAGPSAVGPDGVWHELVMGLLDDGIVLIDDVSLLEDPKGAAVERVQNTDFESGSASWRLLGNHRGSTVVTDPTNPANHVLQLAATGTTEHMHNHAETTLGGGATVKNGTEYRLSFKARWVAGSNQLNSRLYFNRLPFTTLLPMPSGNGTPGQTNSVLEANLGPAYYAFSHWPAVPAAFEPVTVTATARDPDGVTAVDLYYSVDGADPVVVPMSGNGDRFEGQIAGLPAQTIVQFWIVGTDGQSATSSFPSRGPESRALYRVDDAGDSPLNTFRIIVTPADDVWLFTSENLMSNDRIPCTVIWNDREVFYDAGVRLKGSERGRPVTARVGFAVAFNPDQPFHGVLRSVMVDRSEGIGFGQREMLVNLMAMHAGTVSAWYSDLIRVVAPRSAHTGAAELQLTRFEDPMLNAQFEDGSTGSLYEYEYIYYPTTTKDGSPQSPKLPQPDQVVGSSVKSLGPDKEAYRHVFQLKNNRWQDDWSGLMSFVLVFGQDSPDFTTKVAAVIDVDQWLRAFALATLPGAVDHYGNGDGHNAMFYMRPSDGRFLYFPKDLDFFNGSPNGAIVANKDLKRLVASPVNARTFYSHLYDVLQTSYNGTYMAHWCDQLGKLLPTQNFAGHLQFIQQRADWALNGAADSVKKAIPEVAFQILTNAGADFATEAATVALDGQGWVNVHTLWNAAAPLALPLAWTDKTHWSTAVAVACGANLLQLEARDQQGAVVGNDSMTVTRTGAGCQ
jgi:hypothetical protein